MLHPNAVPWIVAIVRAADSIAYRYFESAFYADGNGDCESRPAYPHQRAPRGVSFLHAQSCVGIVKEGPLPRAFGQRCITDL